PGGSELLYPADGTFQDWSSSVGALGYTIELRPTGSPGFDLPPEEIAPTCEENFAATIAMLRFLQNPIVFSFPNGPPQHVEPGQLHAFEVAIESVFDEPINAGSATLHVRYGSGGPFASRSIVSTGDGTYVAELPISHCGLPSEYFFTAETQAGETSRHPEGGETLSVGVTTTVYAWDIDTNPNWNMQGLWDWGVPQGSGGDHGNPDPTSGASGSTVLGYNLAGDYENDLNEVHLTSAPFDLSNHDNASLRFKRYLNVEQPVYDHATIRARAGGGSWVQVWTNQATIEDSQWMDVVYDISEIVGGQQGVQIRWTMGTTDSAWQYSGWNIDDIEILASSENGVLGDTNCDGVVNITDILAIISIWGECNGVCSEDIVPDGSIDVSDLLQVIGNW
ncbi:MAG: M14 family zinc carboxypeptidase, partial [Planctomycetota bacterium]|nr:M14 family zinc carboxypeptidase [Planctomycetota bacterium]